MRITNDIRSQIIVGLIEHRFAKEVALLQMDMITLASDIYCDVYSQKDRDAMDALPNGWVPTSQHIGIAIGSDVQCIRFDGYMPGFGNLMLKTNEELRVPAKDYREWGFSVSKVYEPDSEMALRINQMHIRSAELSKTIDDCQRKAAHMLSKFFSSEKLIEAWPEVEKFIPNIAKEEKNLPAIPVDTFNTMFNLP